MKELFAHLDSFGLGSATSVKDTLSTWADPELTRFFESYTEVASHRRLLHKAEIGTTDIYPDSVTGLLPMETIRQLAIYVNRFYIHDPLLDLADTYYALDTHLERVLKHRSREGRLAEFRCQFANVVVAVLRLRPLAEGGIIHVTPTHFLRRAREPGAVYSSDIYGPDGQLQGSGEIEQPRLPLPPKFVEYINKHLQVFPVRFEGGRAILYVTNDIKPTRAIAVKFDDETRPMVYCLYSLSVPKDRRQGERVINMVFQFADPEANIEDATFRTWVRGECQKYIRQRLDALQTDLVLACKARAHFLTTLRSSHDLANLSVDQSPTQPSIVNALLRIELPYFQNVTMEDVARARANEAAFNDFRVALDKAFREIDKLEGAKFQERVDEISQDLVHAPVARIDSCIKGLKRNVFIDALLATGTLITTIASEGNTLLTLATIATATRALDSYKKYKSQHDQIRQMPSYFYWELTKNARK